MLQLDKIGKEYHEATKHSYLSVMMDPNYVDASTQPSPFKTYPKFYRRFPLEKDNNLAEYIRLTSAITFKKTYKNEVYSLRVNPSAGALYPTEIYLQIRGIKGFIDGIYHLEVATDSLTLIYELIDDGIESYLFPNHLVKGVIFLVSCAYFRSSWKYKNRSIRYCFLDSGHHLGAIEAASYLYDRKIQFIFDFDKIALNEDLGLENKEFITACAISGEIKEKSVKRLRSKVPFVCPTDYFEPNYFIEAGYKRTSLENNLTFNDQQAIPLFNLEKTDFLTTILGRRSARCFKQKYILQPEWELIWQYLKQPITTESREKMQIFLVVHGVEGLESGIYRENELIKKGDFREQAKYLAVNQAIARDSAVTLFFASNYHNYQTATQLSALIGQRIYLIANYLDIGCSGIGAYYDDETKEFLKTNQDILYAMAIGR